MFRKKVVIVDSGVGGLHILKEAQRLRPDCDYVYIADTQNTPYGNKSRAKLYNIAQKLVEEIVEGYEPDVVVFACNTLTTATINRVRKLFPDISFVGVEPALKTAKIYGGDTIILATPSTLKYYKKLEKKVTNELKKEFMAEGLKYKNTDKVFCVKAENLAKKVDDNIDNLDMVKTMLQELLDKSKYKKCQNIVLGCTHYLALKKQIATIFPDIQIFDGAVSVAKRLSDILGTASKSSQKKPIKFIVTDNNKIFKEKIKKYYFLLK